MLIFGGPPVNLAANFRLKILDFRKICQVCGRTLIDHQIQSFEARELLFCIWSPLYIRKWLCVKELTKIAHFQICHRECLLHPLYREPELMTPNRPHPMLGASQYKHLNLKFIK